MNPINMQRHRQNACLTLFINLYKGQELLILRLNDIQGFTWKHSASKS